MLLYFKTRNNLSYKEEVGFSMVAGIYSDHLDRNTIELERYKIRILKTAVIYGQNASGKSNLLKAITNGIIFLQNSFRESPSQNLPFFYNLNDRRNQKEPTSYVYGILVDGIHFEYSFSFDSERIVEEQLLEYKTQRPIQHFYRTYNSEIKSYDWSFSSHFTGKKETVRDITNQYTLYLTIGAQTELPVATKVLNWFRNDIVWSMDFDSPGNLSPDYTLRRIKNNPALKEGVMNFLKEADFTIVDLVIKETKEGTIRGATVHKTVDLDGNESYMEFDLTYESAGTNRFIAWIGVWIDVLEKGLTLLIDELGNSMHTLLSKHLVSEFHTIENKGGQLIFTTHDTNLMTQEIFRRDQIWIVDRDKLGNSLLYPMSDFKIKKGKVLENSYLQGTYGGIPHIS